MNTDELFSENYEDLPFELKKKSIKEGLTEVFDASEGMHINYNQIMAAYYRLHGEEVKKCTVMTTVQRYIKLGYIKRVGIGLYALACEE